MNKEKTTTHSNGGFFDNVEKEKQILAKKAAEKSRKLFLEPFVSLFAKIRNPTKYQTDVIWLFQHRQKQRSPKEVNR